MHDLDKFIKALDIIKAVVLKAVSLQALAKEKSKVAEEYYCRKCEDFFKPFLGRRPVREPRLYK